ncbi:JAB domain-containing protein [Pontiellaceae bacterium B12219]|nr:JAB domain-containing protein [Pontiellaceae bacterium B12219]
MVILDAADVAQLFRLEADIQEESFYALLLDDEFNALQLFPISVDIAMEVADHDCAKLGLTAPSNVAAIILVHNKPSGDLEPTKLDSYFAGNLARYAHWRTNSPVLDHVIIGPNPTGNTGYRSLRRDNFDWIFGSKKAATNYLGIPWDTFESTDEITNKEQ